MHWFSGTANEPTIPGETSIEPVGEKAQPQNLRGPFAITPQLTAPISPRVPGRCIAITASINAAHRNAHMSLTRRARSARRVNTTEFSERRKHHIIYAGSRSALPNRTTGESPTPPGWQLDSYHDLQSAKE